MLRANLYVVGDRVVGIHVESEKPVAFSEFEPTEFLDSFRDQFKTLGFSMDVKDVSWEGPGMSDTHTRKLARLAKDCFLQLAGKESDRITQEPKCSQ